MSGLGILFMRRGTQAHPTVGSGYIKFKDEAVFNLLMSKGISSDGIGITKEDAENVKNIGNWFQGNTTITQFDELVYFTQVKSIANNAFASCSALTTINISNVTSIGYRVFIDCKVLTGDFEMLNLTGGIGVNAFQNTKIKSFIAPNMTTIGNYAFSGCKDLERIDISGATTIGNFAFNGCSLLRSADISNATFVDYYAFYGCSSMQSIVCRADTPPQVHSNAFASSNNCPIYVPDASVDAYKTATGWSSYAARIKPLSEYQG